VSYEASADSLVDDIHVGRYGRPLVRSNHPADDPFFVELAAHAKTLENKGEPAVSPSGIRNWLRPVGQSKSPKRKGKTFLRDYLRWFLTSPHVSQAASPESLWRIEQFLTRTLPQPKTPAPPLDRVVATRMQHLFDVSSRNPRPVATDLFREGDPNDDNDSSYFLHYRHSTNWGSVMKSFIVLHKPDPKIFSHYGFDHFIHGGERFKTGHIFRECEGAILKMQTSYYFLGYNFTVKANKQTEAALYARLREEAKEAPNGIGVTSVEYADIDADPGLFAGVTMTIAAEYQPLVGRAALLHLGTRSSLGCEIRDTDVDPMELDPRDLANDLKKMIDRLKAKGCERFGMHLQTLVNTKTWDRSGSRRLAQDILAMIDNTPAWEIQRGSKAGRARGALESFGKKRPRN
jgi:hypothetical protein